MISPHTPPGTALVAVWLEGLPHVLAVFRPVYHPYLRMLNLMGGPAGWGIKLGQRCTLVKIHPCPQLVSGFACQIAEAEGSYPLECFDVASLPKAITAILRGEPVDGDEKDAPRRVRRTEDA